MRWERQEFFPMEAGKGCLISSYKAETGLLWMWAGPSCFLSSGDGYFEELLELPKGFKDPFKVQKERCDFSQEAVADKGLISPEGQSSVQSFCRVQLFATPGISAGQASLSIPISPSSLSLTSIESVIQSSHLILSDLLLLLPPIPPSISLFQ